MVRLLWFLKRKPGMTFEQFREHYENIHSRFGQQYFGHLFIEYRRHYDRASEQGLDCSVPGLPASGYDCIAEWLLRDEEAFAEWGRLLQDPVIGRIFDEDGARFMDRTATRLVVCDTRDTGPGDGAETLRLQAERSA
jgi:EthD domain